MPIAEPVEGVERALKEMFAGRTRDITEENIQSRARGLILMAISNKTGAMVVTTGNKSEMSVGYATLYGDMNGGFNPIKDLYKMEVFRLSALRNRWKPAGALGPDGEVIPENIIVKPPSAELRENQKDEDLLPPYPVLDGILRGLVEKEMRVADIVAEGYDPETVRKVERLLYLAEYKRRQSAPGVKVGPKNFGRDRRYPIVNRFRDPGTAGAEAGRLDRAAQAGRNERAVRGIGKAGRCARFAQPAASIPDISDLAGLDGPRRRFHAEGCVQDRRHDHPRGRRGRQRLLHRDRSGRRLGRAGGQSRGSSAGSGPAKCSAKCR